MIVVLDAGPLSLIANPAASEENEAAAGWLQGLLSAGVRVIVPEIADYELRRELIRADRRRGLDRLNRIGKSLYYLPLTTAVMHEAARLWAHVRLQGRPTAPDEALDGDAILAAQARALQTPSEKVIIATTNVKHLSLFAEARHWRDIRPE